MSCLFWNCSGLGNPRSVQVLVDLVHTKRLDFIFLSETKCEQVTIKWVARKLGFLKSFVVNKVGMGGGLALLWRKGFEVKLRGFSHNYIDVAVSDKSGKR